MLVMNQRNFYINPDKVPWLNDVDIERQLNRKY